MGPRSGEHGEPSTTLMTVVAVVGASMGPRSGEHGEGAVPDALAFAAARFNGAALW